MKKIARLLAMGICVLLVTLLLRGYTAAFTAAHFPDTQPGTYWTDEDGILTVRVSDGGSCVTFQSKAIGIHSFFLIISENRNNSK